MENSKEPYTLLWLDVIYRRFGIEEFSDAFERYDDLLNDNPKQASLLRLFRRIGDYNNPFSNQDFNSALVDLDQITIPALYCDRITLSKDYFEMLDQAGTKGDYLLTHGNRIWGFAVDDLHWPKGHLIFKGWIMVEADKLTKEDILNAIKKGDFYSSTGVVIDKYLLTRKKYI